MGFDSHGPKIAIFGSALGLRPGKKFQVINLANGKVAFTAALSTPLQVKDWATGKIYYQADFSSFNTSGKYYITVTRGGVTGKSPAFVIEEDALAKLTIPSIIHYYNKQRANTLQEIAADSKVNLYGSDKTVDMHGGWCDASGDVSKYFSHLAYANYVSPQQTPLVVWSLANAVDAIPGLLSDLHVKDSMVNEALWGADYIMRLLSKDDYFYMIIFSYFNKDPSARRVVGLHAKSVTTDEYQAAFREGGGRPLLRWQKLPDGNGTENIHHGNTWTQPNELSLTCL